MSKEIKACPVNRAEVKKNLQACAGAGLCLDCSYRHTGNCVQILASDVLAYVEYLEELLNDVPRKI